MKNYINFTSQTFSLSLIHMQHLVSQDTDVMWLRNPFTRLSKNETEDFHISTDTYLGDPWSEKNLMKYN